MNLSPTIDLIELVVVILGVIGLTISLVMAAIIQGDRRNVRVSGLNGINKRMTNADLRNEISRTYKLLCFVVVGLWSMMLPPSFREDNRIAGDLFKWMLISWEVVAVANSLWAYVDRKRNIESLKNMTEHKTGGK